MPPPPPAIVHRLREVHDLAGHGKGRHRGDGDVFDVADDGDAHAAVWRREGAATKAGSPYRRSRSYPDPRRSDTLPGMKAEILSIGTEILLGEIIDTNAAYIASRLPALGVDLYFKAVVGDNLERLTDTIRNARERSDVVICTGGLGPTEDDLTREAICAVLGEEPHVDPQLEADAARLLRAARLRDARAQREAVLGDPVVPGDPEPARHGARAGGSSATARSSSRCPGRRPR